MPKLKTTEEFIKDAKLKHGNTYDYSNVNYVNSKTPIIINCSIHGPFKQWPQHHLSGSGCPRCNRKIGGNKRRKNTEKFIESAIKKHGNKYDYSEVEYTTNNTRIKIKCKTHGMFTQTPRQHLLGHGCSKCALEKNSLKRRNSQNNFIQRAQQIHNNKYKYTTTNYITVKHKVNIICPIHGEFNQLAESHLAGYGCPICGNVGIYNDIYFETNPEDKQTPAYLYLMELSSVDKSEQFIKIGITRNSPVNRKHHISPYLVKLHRTANIPLWDAYCLEFELLNIFSEHQYTPSLFFGGYTECLQYCLKDELIQIFDTICHTQNNAPTKNVD